MDAETLTAAARCLGVAVDEEQHGQLERFVNLLNTWNARFNLVSRRDIARLWPRHVLDSLSILPMIREYVPLTGAGGDGDGDGGDPDSDKTATALDVGTGAGFPGIPLAIAESALRWHLVDRNARKVRFLDTVVAELGLSNVVPVCFDIPGQRGHGRLASAETLDARLIDSAGGAFDLIVSRAVGPPRELLAMAGGWLRPGGVMVLQTGTGVTESDLLPLDGPFREEARHYFEIPGLDRAHEVTIIRHTG